MPPSYEKSYEKKATRKLFLDTIQATGSRNRSAPDVSGETRRNKN